MRLVDAPPGADAPGADAAGGGAAGPAPGSGAGAGALAGEPGAWRDVAGFYPEIVRWMDDVAARPPYSPAPGRRPPRCARLMWRSGSTVLFAWLDGTRWCPVIERHHKRNRAVIVGKCTDADCPRRGGGERFVPPQVAITGLCRFVSLHWTAGSDAPKPWGGRQPEYKPPEPTNGNALHDPNAAMQVWIGHARDWELRLAAHPAPACHAAGDDAAAGTMKWHPCRVAGRRGWEKTDALRGRFKAAWAIARHEPARPAAADGHDAGEYRLTYLGPIPAEACPPRWVHAASRTVGLTPCGRYAARAEVRRDGPIVIMRFDTGAGKTHQMIDYVKEVWDEWFAEAGTSRAAWVDMTEAQQQQLLAAHGDGPLIKIILPLRSLETDWRSRMAALPWVRVETYMGEDMRVREDVPDMERLTIVVNSCALLEPTTRPDPESGEPPRVPDLVIVDEPSAVARQLPFAAGPRGDRMREIHATLGFLFQARRVIFGEAQADEFAVALAECADPPREWEIVECPHHPRQHTRVLVVPECQARLLLTLSAENSRPVYVWCGQADDAVRWAAEWKHDFPELAPRCLALTADTDPHLYDR
eukprot:gene5994-15784_t